VKGREEERKELETCTSLIQLQQKRSSLLPSPFLPPDRLFTGNGPAVLHNVLLTHNSMTDSSTYNSLQSVHFPFPPSFFQSAPPLPTCVVLPLFCSPSIIFHIPSNYSLPSPSFFKSFFISFSNFPSLPLFSSSFHAHFASSSVSIFQVRGFPRVGFFVLSGKLI